MLNGARGFARHNATNGEFIQGQLPSGDFFHVTFPLGVYSEISVIASTDKRGIQVPEACTKILHSAELTLKHFGLENLGLDISIASHIPTGKGLGSSTADTVATAKAIASMLNKDINRHTLAKIATTVESSDGSMHPGMVCFGQRNGKLMNDYRWWPPILSVTMDTGGVVNTVEACKREYNDDEREQCHGFLERFEVAVKNRDLKELGLATSESAFLNQRYLPRQELSIFKELATECGALGISIAHTGTLISLLFDEMDHLKAVRAKQILRKMYPEKNIYNLSTIYGL